MRREDKQIKDKTIIESVMKEAIVCRIGLSEDNIPYVIPMNFGFKDNYLYLHSANKGKKIDILRKNSRICFEVDIKHEIVKSEMSCNWSMKYYSVIGFGRAYLVNSFDEKRVALDIIAEKYSGKASLKYPDSEINKIEIIKVEIETMTGKKSGY